MFRPLSLFSSIPCPSLLDGNSCELIQCLFSHTLTGPETPKTKPIEKPTHPVEEEPALEPTTGEKRKSDTPDPRLVAIVEGAAGKRRKVVEADDEEEGGVSLRKPEKENKVVKKTSPVMERKKPVKPGTAGVMKAGTTKVMVTKASTPSIMTKSATTKSATTTPPPPPPSRKPTVDEKPIPLMPKPIDRAPAAHKSRHNSVTLLHAELTRLLPPAKTQTARNDIIRKAIEIEVEHATTKQAAYTSAMGRYIMRLKKLSPKEYQSELAAQSAAVTPAPAAESSSTTELDNTKPALTTGITPAEELTRLLTLTHTPEILLQTDYLLTPPTSSEIAAAQSSLTASNGWETCDRCSTRFRVFPDRTGPGGSLTSNGPCTYHPLRPRTTGPRPTIRSSEPPKSTHPCCNNSPGTSGCATVPSHVFKPTRPARLAAYWQFAPTPAPTSPVSPETSPRAIALDAEMCYTTQGLEICRLSCTAWPSHTVLLDALVRPFGEILDFNTRFSGITATMYSNTTPYLPPSAAPPLSSSIINPTAPVHPHSPMPLLASPTAAREALWGLMGVGEKGRDPRETVLIGHGLANDLEALRMCHEKVVDTVVVFPHRRGGGMRNRLKWIVEAKLGRAIQMDELKGGEGGDKGHDSVIDARCAGEAVRWKIREGIEGEKKRRGCIKR